MSRFFESMECRILLSALPPQAQTILNDAKALGTDIKAIRTALKNCAKAEAADLKTLNADLRSSRTASNRTLLTTLRTDERTCMTTILKDLGALFGPSNADVHRILGEDRKLLKTPSDTATRTKLTADLTKLQTDASTAALSAEFASCQTMLNTDLAAISSANPSTSSDVTTARGTLATCRTNLDGSVGTLNTDVARFRTDAGNV